MRNPRALIALHALARMYGGTPVDYLRMRPSEFGIVTLAMVHGMSHEKKLRDRAEAEANANR